MIDSNGYIPIGSCHHPSWLKAIPKRQFQGIRRNCTEMQPRQLLENKDFFLPKEYQDDVLEQEMNAVLNTGRDSLLTPKADKYTLIVSVYKPLKCSTK